MKKIEFAPDVIDKQRKAIEQLEKAVGSTLGPRGFFVQFYEDGEPTITNDGVTVAKNFELDDPIENSAVDLVKQASIETNSQVGDGTTAAVILTRAFVEKGWELIKAGRHPFEVKLAFDRVAEFIRERVPTLSREAKDEETLIAVASLSANNDRSIGEPVGKLAAEVGEEGTMYIDENDAEGIKTDLIEGYTFNSGVSSFAFLSQGLTVTTINDPSILLYDGRLISGRDMFMFLEKMAKAGVERLVIICREIDGEALKVAATNKLQEQFDVTVINAPGYAKIATAGYLRDLAVLTGATVVSEEAGIALADTHVTALGTCSSISSRIDKTLMLFGEGFDKKRIDDYIKKLKEEKQSFSDEYAKAMIDKRIAELTQKTGVVKVGASNQVALRDMQFRADDAIHAATAAYKSGVVPGGGTALARIAWEAPADISELEGEIIAVLDAPFQRIVTNAAKEPETVRENMAEGEVWDATTDEYVDPNKAGILDPTDVVVTAATQALKVAGMVITTSAVISKTIVGRK